MNNNIKGYFCAIAYLVFWVGLSVLEVGEMSGSSKPCQWYFPLLVAGFIIPPFIFGFWAADRRKK